MKRNSGLTMIELMVAVCFLMIGVLLVQEGFLRSAALYGRYANSMRARLLVPEKLWEAREQALYEGAEAGTSGTFESDGRSFQWELSAFPEGESLYDIRMVTRWEEGGRTVVLDRQVYAAKVKKPLGQ